MSEIFQSTDFVVLPCMDPPSIRLILRENSNLIRVDRIVNGNETEQVMFVFHMNDDFSAYFLLRLNLTERVLGIEVGVVIGGKGFMQEFILI